MKGRGVVLHEPTRTRAAVSLTTMGCMDRAEGPNREAADIRSPSELPGYRCCGASPVGSQETCSGLAAGSGGGEPRLGVVLPLMNTARHTHMWGHTHRDKYHIQTWTHLCLLDHKQGLRPTVVVRDLGLPFSSPETLTAPLRKPQHHPTPHQPIQQKTNEHIPG